MKKRWIAIIFVVALLLWILNIVYVLTLIAKIMLLVIFIYAIWRTYKFLTT